MEIYVVIDDEQEVLYAGPNKVKAEEVARAGILRRIYVWIDGKEVRWYDPEDTIIDMEE